MEAARGFYIRDERETKLWRLSLIMKYVKKWLKLPTHRGTWPLCDYGC